MATRFKNLTDKFGPANAQEIIGADTGLATMTVANHLGLTVHCRGERRHLSMTEVAAVACLRGSRRPSSRSVRTRREATD